MASVFQHAIVPRIIVLTTTSTVAVPITTVTNLVYSWLIQAGTSNSVNVYVGASDVGANNSSGVALAAKDSESFEAMYDGGTNLKQYDLSQYFIRTSAATALVVIQANVEERQT